MIAIIDIDNCIADDSHRLHLIDESIEDLDERYGAYHHQMFLDRPHNKEIIERHTDYGDHICFVTSRPERYRETTWKWLTMHFDIPHGTSLFMRPEGNHDHSHILKPALLSLHNIHVSAVNCAYDDRQEVLDAYVAMGIKNVQRVTVYDDVGVPRTLRKAAKTFEQRNAVYGDSYKSFGKVMMALFPNGLELDTVDEWNRAGVLFMMVSKLMRYAVQFEHGGHQDSAHDLCVYSAMLEEMTK